MKILMLHPHDVYAHPWMIRPIKIAEELIRRGNTVTLAYIMDKKRLDRDGIIHKNIPDKLTLVRLRWPRRRIFENKRTILKLAKNFDVIHFQKCSSGIAFPAVAVSSELDKPLHYDWDDNESGIAKEMGIRGLELFNVHWYEDRLPKIVDTISVSSQALREKAIQLGMPENRIFSAPVGADLDFFNPQINADKIKAKHNLKGNVVIYSGQLDGVNYVDLLIRGIPKINASVPNTTFIIVGGGNTLLQHQQRAKELGVKNIIFTGYLPHDEIPEYLAAADVAVACFEDTPVTRCKSPLKIAEYLASGKAIVASRVGETVPMVEGCGTLVAPGNWEELAQQIINLLSNPALRKEYSLKARQQAEQKYNWKNTVDNLEKAYRLAIESPRTNRKANRSYLLPFSLITFSFFVVGFFKKNLRLEVGREFYN
jgi:glycosyltransferase involved in cell wall biosynthesis